MQGVHLSHRCAYESESESYSKACARRRRRRRRRPYYFTGQRASPLRFGLWSRPQIRAWIDSISNVCLARRLLMISLLYPLRSSLSTPTVAVYKTRDSPVSLVLRLLFGPAFVSSTPALSYSALLNGSARNPQDWTAHFRPRHCKTWSSANQSRRK